MYCIQDQFIERDNSLFEVDEKELRLINRILKRDENLDLIFDFHFTFHGSYNQINWLDAYSLDEDCTKYPIDLEKHPSIKHYLLTEAERIADNKTF